MAQDATRKLPVRKKPLRVSIGVLLLLAVSVPLYRVLKTPRPLNVAGFDSIRPGMTEQEVEAILGGPAGDYGRHRSAPATMTLEGFLGPVGTVEEDWFDDDHRLEVWFDESDRVVAVHERAGFSRRPEPLSIKLSRIIRQMRSWLGL